MRTIMLTAALAAATAVVSCSSVDKVTTGSLQPIQDRLVNPSKPNPMLSVVKVNTIGGGHGSGVYIGNGIVITAAHVTVNGITTLVSNSSKYISTVEVLWQNEKYDIAAVRLTSLADALTSGLYPANLKCRTPVDGENIVARGSPGGDDFLALRGYVAGAVRKKAPAWEEVFVADMSLAAGVSGGPVFDENNDVIGIAVGVATAVMPHNGAPKARGDIDITQTGISYVVPATTVCKLLGRV